LIEELRILFIGDIVGRVGREVVGSILPKLKEEYKHDFILANAENASGGFGLTKKIANQLFSQGVNLLTSGNHIWSRKEIYGVLEEEERILRPLNYPKGVPGRGAVIVKVNEVLLGIINLAGRVFLKSVDCPFKVAKDEIREMRKKTKNIIVDIHCEATSEKVAMGWYLDGKVSAVIGTHTHVQTADERILPKGTAYITDVGMTGPIDSVIGVKKDSIIKRFITQIPVRLEVAKGKGKLDGVLIDIDPTSGFAKRIKRIQVEME
jgi:hypothetical protein